MSPVIHHRVVFLTSFVLTAALASAACGGGAHSPQATHHPAATAMADSPSSKMPGPPIAAVREVVDRYFGVEVGDAYRWMETPGSAEFDGWLRGQDAFARSELARLPGRVQLTARTTELAKMGARVEGVRKAGDKYFYLTRPAGAELWRLCVRDQRSAAERVLVDAERLSREGAHASIDYFVPSPDGKLVAFGISTNGSEETSLQVIEATTGRVLSERVDRTGFANLSWLPDGRAFFYMRYPKLAPGTPSSEGSRRMRVYVHVLGTSAEADRAVFGFGVTPSVSVSEDDFPFVMASAGSAHVVGWIQHGVRSEWTLYTALSADIVRGNLSWRKIADVEDGISTFAMHNDEIFALTHRDAPRSKLVRSDLARGVLSGAKVVVPESDVVLQEISPPRPTHCMLLSSRRRSSTYDGFRTRR